MCHKLFIFLLIIFFSFSNQSRAIDVGAVQANVAVLGAEQKRQPAKSTSYFDQY